MTSNTTWQFNSDVFACLPLRVSVNRTESKHETTAGNAMKLRRHQYRKLKRDKFKSGKTTGEIQTITSLLTDRVQLSHHIPEHSSCSAPVMLQLHCASNTPSFSSGNIPGYSTFASSPPLPPFELCPPISERPQRCHSPPGDYWHKGGLGDPRLRLLGMHRHWRRES